MLDDEANPLLQGFFTAHHGGGGEKQRIQIPLCAGHSNKGLSVSYALLFTQSLNGGLVAGKLRVLLGKYYGYPNQRIIPVEDKTDATQEGPNMVKMPKVGQFMC